MPIHVILSISGSVGDRPGGLVVAVMPIISAAGVGGPVPDSPPGEPDPVDQANRQYFGQRPSGLGEAINSLYQRYQRRGSSWGNFILSEDEFRNAQSGAAGPNVEVRAQWLADP